MNKIIRKEQFSEKVFLFEIEAPLIAKSRKAKAARLAILSLYASTSVVSVCR